MRIEGIYMNNLYTPRPHKWVITDRSPTDIYIYSYTMYESKTRLQLLSTIAYTQAASIEDMVWDYLNNIGWLYGVDVN